MRVAPPPSPSAPLPAALAGGGTYIVVGQLVRGLVRLAGLLILARLLLPREFGLFGMAMVAHGIYAVVRDAGLNTAAVQAPELRADDQTRLFWFGLLAGAFTGLVMAGSAVGVVQLFAEPGLLPLLLALASAHFIWGIAAASRIQLVRAHRFRQVAVIEGASFAVATALAIVLAVAGAGAWAMVAQILVQEVVQSAWLGIAAKNRPGRWPGIGTSGRAMLHFGFGVMLFNLLNYAGQSVDQALVGGWFGAHSLGIYGRAWFIAMLPAQFLLGPLTGWMVQSLATHRDSPEGFMAWFRLVVGGGGVLTASVAALMLATPDLLVRSLLGARWTEASPLLAPLAMLTLAQTLLSAEAWVLLARRRGGLLAGVTFVRLVVSIGVCFAARSGGPPAIAFALSLWLLISSGAAVPLLASNSPLRWVDAVTTFFAPWAWGALLAAVCLWFRPDSLPALALIVVVCAGSVYLLVPAVRAQCRAWLRLLPWPAR